MTACVVTHQGAGRLPATLAALAAAGPVEEVIVVDSGSTDGSPEVARRHLPGARVLELGANLGPAVARNRGWGAAQGARVLFVDDDVVPDPGCVEALVAALTADPEAALALPRVVSAAPPGRVDFEGADAHWLGLMALRRAGDEPGAPDGGATPVGSMVSACFLLDRARWGDDPPFDESFGFNYEDHDFGLRCRIRGHRILAVPAATCRHGEGTPGLSMRRGRPYPRERAFHLIRGRWVILLKDVQLRTLLVLAPALALYESVQLALALRRGWVREWLKAAGWMAAHLPAVLAARRRVQAARALPDRALLTGGPLPFRPELPGGRMERGGLALLERLFGLYWRIARRAL